jgi:hypothetical protein
MGKMVGLMLDIKRVQIPEMLMQSAPDFSLMEEMMRL